MSTLPKRSAGLLATLMLGASVLAGCVLPTNEEPEQSSAAPTSSEQPSASIGASADLPQAWIDAIADVEADTGSQVSLAIVSPGHEQPRYAGSLAPKQPAWSTIKVPLSIAALRKDPSLEPVMEEAIRASDNAAADQLWESLGGGEAAAAAVEAVLAEAGTPADVPATRSRAQFSAFGQTEWSTGQQATFAAALPKLEGAQPVLDAMGQVVEDQAYGLGNIEGARFKGGWGPDTSGAYLVRQFGLMNKVSIAVAVRPANGTYETGQATLNKVVQAIEPLMDTLDAQAQSSSAQTQAPSTTAPSSTAPGSTAPSTQAPPSQPSAERVPFDSIQPV